jgi:hypothetical protein
MVGEWTVVSEDGPASRRFGALERGSVDDVSLGGDGAEPTLVVLFRSGDRPDAVFGWRVPIWPAPAPDNSDDDGTPEGCAFILSVNLRELIDTAPGLPGWAPDAPSGTPSPGLTPESGVHQSGSTPTGEGRPQRAFCVR